MSVTSGHRRLEPADVAFAGVLVLTFAFYLYEVRGNFFFADEWNLAARGHSLRDFVRPYNGHLSIVCIAVFRLLFAIFGLRHHLPVGAVGVACLCSVPAALHIAARRRIGAGAAGVVAIAVLWYHGMTLEAGALNHWLALTATVVLAAALLDARPGSDWVVLGALAFALASAGGGVAAAAGAIVFLVCTRPRRGRRWLVVLAPTAAWVVWWLLEGRGSAPVPKLVRYELHDIVRVSWQGVRASFDGLVLGNRWCGLVLLVAFGVLLALRLRGGPSTAANQLAWTGALVVWWVGILASRGALARPDVFRYQFVGSVLVVLAALPTEPVAWRLRIPAPAAAAAVVGVGALLAAAQHDQVAAWSVQQRAFARTARQVALVASVQPPIELHIPRGLGAVSDADYRRAVQFNGAPRSVTRRTLDRELVAAGIRLEPVASGRSATCKPGRGPLDLGARGRVTVDAHAKPVTVEIRRFGDRFVPVGTVPPGDRARLVLRTLGAKEHWTVRVDGGCVVRR